MPGKSGSGSRGSNTRQPVLGTPDDTVDPYLPHNGNLGYRISRYDLDLEYKVASNRLAGVATLTATSYEDLHRFTLDMASSLAVDRITVNDKRVRYSHRRNKLAITPDAGVPPGGALTIVIRYHGTPRPIRSPWGAVGWEELTDGALCANQPNGAASWFPCDDHPSAKAPYRISITTDSPYHALANGVLESKRVAPDRPPGSISRSSRCRPTWHRYRSVNTSRSRWPPSLFRYVRWCHRAWYPPSGTTSAANSRW